MAQSDYKRIISMPAPEVTRVEKELTMKTEIKRSPISVGECQKIIEVVKPAVEVAGHQDFMFFLSFCSDRLNTGKTVAEIWAEYQAFCLMKKEVNNYG